MTQLRILLADDHTLVRAGLRALLTTFPSVTVVGEATNGREALERARALQPDVVLMDISMKDLNGLEATALLRKEVPKARVIVLSMHVSEDYVMQALRAGAAGYLIKDAAPLELELALQAVMRGETYLSPAISKQIVDGYVQRLDAEESPQVQLTPRQREILQLIAEGKSTKEIAFRLEVSVKTVETHRAQLMERLGIRDVPGLTRYAIRIGLVSP
ncbi:response regulator [Aromatoleum evansii]|uniref:response regulator n=1 Tax=Aromatoleum evansii TaxID=59406 RepID=UPI00145ED1F0|nr:response regulator transcription factor [Aromatoleum evansii]NMG31619.1 response regulator [Aromatoleum evansii]